MSWQATRGARTHCERWQDCCGQIGREGARRLADEVSSWALSSTCRVPFWRTGSRVWEMTQPQKVCSASGK